HGYDEVFGARPLKRLIQKEIGDKLAMALLEGKVTDGDVVKVTVGADPEAGLVIGA
ncbi:MAG: ATP-dependent Clp protease ATP-binding subunit ClpB, partial [Actinomycetota bacterium]